MLKNRSAAEINFHFQQDSRRLMDLNYSESTQCSGLRFAEPQFYDPEARPRTRTLAHLAARCLFRMWSGKLQRVAVEICTQPGRQELCM
jgi:hypothetical protein